MPDLADGHQGADPPAPPEPTPDPPAPTPDAPTDPPEPQPDGDGRFDRAYVEQLHAEAAARRVEAKAATERGDAMATRLGALTVTQAAAGILDDPADLTRYVDAAELAGDDGLPDPEKVKAAAEKLATDKPTLAKRRIAGDAGQGPRGTPTPPPVADFAEILRGAVR